MAHFTIPQKSESETLDIFLQKSTLVTFNAHPQPSYKKT